MSCWLVFSQTERRSLAIPPAHWLGFGTHGLHIYIYYYIVRYRMGAWAWKQQEHALLWLFHVENAPFPNPTPTNLAKPHSKVLFGLYSYLF
jgi:hypothetical protein